MRDPGIDPEGRRRVLKIVTAAGIGSVAFGRALESLAADGAKITPSMIARAEWISGLRLDPTQRKMLVDGLERADRGYAAARSVPIDNGVPPAFQFRPIVGPEGASSAAPAASREPATIARPATDEDLAFASVETLSGLLRSGKVSSRELTRLYLDRLRRLDSKLLAAISVTEDRAMREAERADAEIAAGRWRGPLHGVPWLAKDLLSVPGYRTTWGSVPYREQRREETAAVVERLDAAGAVLLAKTAVGELAMGDVWYGGTTKNPWKLDQGSSGSSAGSAAAIAAGIGAFAIGTETLGSIVSPCTRCGASGLRPTFGRVSRFGCMALSWTMDKIGPIARDVRDLGTVLGAIHGADPRDPASVDAPFDWPSSKKPESLRIGWVPALFDFDYGKWAEPGEDPKGYEEWRSNDRAVIEVLKGLGYTLIEIDFTTKLPVDSLESILLAEAAAAFDDLTRSGRDATLVRQTPDAWPNLFRTAQWMPAVEYLRASRIRTLLQRETEQVLGEVDVWVTPSYGGDQLLRSNLTGHPAVVVPNGFRWSDGTPTSITFMGRLWREADALVVARGYQRATDWHLRRPVL